MSLCIQNFHWHPVLGWLDFLRSRCQWCRIGHWSTLIQTIFRFYERPALKVTTKEAVYIVTLRGWWALAFRKIKKWFVSTLISDQFYITYRTGSMIWENQVTLPSMYLLAILLTHLAKMVGLFSEKILLLHQIRFIAFFLANTCCCYGHTILKVKLLSKISTRIFL